MRIIAGICRGKKLKSVKGTKTRPTADRVKEAVFNVLGPRIFDANFLDLFSGTGSIGIEALSRGAEFAYFVEEDRNALQVIKENIQGCAMEEKSKILPLDWVKALNNMENIIKFHLVYMDPPYKLEIIEQLLEKLVEKNLLNENGIVIAETSANAQTPSGFKNLTWVREKRYGDTKITYYQFKEEDNNGSI
ncbi:MAG: 16S rRNA (guanine(966)-N(2))-methyltransferase RsmD [Bacillota bacterium]